MSGVWCVATASTTLTWGNVECNAAIDPVDALKLLRFDAGLEVQQEDGCPEIGEAVTPKRLAPSVDTPSRPVPNAAIMCQHLGVLCYASSD